MLDDVHSLQKKFVTAKVPRHRAFPGTNFCSPEGSGYRAPKKRINISILWIHWQRRSLRSITSEWTVDLVPPGFSVVRWNLHALPLRGNVREMCIFEVTADQLLRLSCATFLNTIERCSVSLRQLSFLFWHVIILNSARDLLSADNNSCCLPTHHRSCTANRKRTLHSCDVGWAWTESINIVSIVYKSQHVV